MRKLLKTVALSTAALALCLGLSGCREQSASSSAEATADKPMILT